MKTYFAEINKNGSGWSWILRNTMGGGTSSGAKTIQWALYRILSKNATRKECLPEIITINGKPFSKQEAKNRFIKSQYILENLHNF